MSLHPKYLASGNLIEKQSELYQTLKFFDAFLVLISTDYDKLIGQFVDCKFEDTREISYEINGDEFEGKLANQ